MSYFNRRFMFLGIIVLSMFLVFSFMLVYPASVEAVSVSDQAQLASLSQALASLKAILVSLKSTMLFAQVSSTSCPSGYYYMGDSGGYCKSDTDSSLCQPLGGGATYTCTSTYASPSPYTSTSSSCSSSLVALLGDGCHYMHVDSSGNSIYCDGPMTKSAKSGDTTATSGCSSSGSTSTYTSSTTSSCPSGYYSMYSSGASYCQSSTNSTICQPSGGGATYTCPTTTTTTTTTSTTSSSCSSLLVSLLGDGCHYMYADSSGNSIYCDGPMTKSAKSGDTTTTSGCSSSSYTSSSPSPSPTSGTTTYSSGSAGLTAMATASDVVLDWNDFYGGEDEYWIERKVGTGSWTKIGTIAFLAGGKGTYRDVGVAGGVYDYHVKPCMKTSSCFGESNTARVTVGGSSTSTTAPKTAVPPPVISGVATASITSNSATIGWVTDISSNSKVEYWITGGSRESKTDTGFVINHSIALTGLQASTTYNYNVVSSSQDYYSTTFSNKTFTTVSGSPSLPPTSSCPSGYYSMYSSGTSYCQSSTNSTVCQPSGGGTTYTCPTSTYTTTTTSTTCSSSLIAILGDGCHYMYNDASANSIYCDGPMTKSAKSGDVTATTGCSSSSSTTYSTSCPSGYYYMADSAGNYCKSNTNSTLCQPLSGGATYTCPTSTYTTTSSSCSSSLVALLGNDCHYMYSDASANPIYCDGPMTKSAKSGDTTTTAGCTYSGNPSPSPYPSASPTYGSCTYGSESTCMSDSTCQWFSGSGYNYCDSKSSITYVGDANSCPGFAYSRWDFSNKRYCQLNRASACQYNYPDYLDKTKYSAANCSSSVASGVPQAPTSLTAVQEGGAVRLTWADNATNETEYKIEWKNSSGTWIVMGSTGVLYGGSGTYKDYPSSGRTHEYRVKACNASGCSGESNIAFVTTTTTEEYITYPFKFPGSGKTCNTRQECYDYCKTTSGSGTGDSATCDQYFPGATGEKTTVPPYMTSLVPMSGPIGTQVMIYGSGFSTIGNRINFDTGVIMDVPSPDGKFITFTVPKDRVPLCAVTDPRCLLPAPYNPVKPGTYWVSVTNANVTSNYFSFGVTEAIASVFAVDAQATQPKQGATGVDVTTRIKVKLTRELDPASTYKEFFRFAKTVSPDSRVSGSFSMFSDGFEFTPYGDLEPNTGYTYTILTTIRDRSGMPLSAPYSGSFVTGSTSNKSGIIIGKVTDANGVVISKAYVRAFSSFAVPYYGTTSYVPQDYFSRNTETDAAGLYQLFVPPGTYFIEAYPPHERTDLTRAAPKEVLIKGSEIKTADIVFGGIPKVITGAVRFSNGNPVLDAEVGAYASETRQWTSGKVDANGSYTLKVNGGSWFVGIHPQGTGSSTWSWNEKPASAVFAFDQTIETKTVDFTVPLRDATLMISAVDESGAVFGTVGMVVDTHSASSVSTSFSSPPEFRFTGSDGKATFTLRLGTYYVRAYIPSDRGYLNPDEQQITIIGGDKKELKLVFRKKQQASLPTISGVTKIEEGVPVDAFIWAWSERGGFVSARANNQGAFSFTVTPNERWHVGAGKEYKDFPYKSPELLVEVKNSSVTIDLALTKQTLAPLPPTINVTEAAAKQVVAQVSDGAQITVPPSGAASSGNIRVEIKPTVEAPAQAGTDIVSTVYDVKIHDTDGKEVTSLTKEVEIVIPYSEEELKNQGVSEDALVPSFFDEKSGTWVSLDDCTIDKVRNVAVCRVDHLTRFALVARGDRIPPDAPADVKLAALGNARIGITWKNPVKDFDYAKIYRSTKLGELGAVRSTSLRGKEFVDQQGLASGVTYHYAVRAVDTAGNESTNTTQQSVVAVGAPASAAVSAKTATTKKVIAKTLRQGVRGDEVKTLQEALIQEGLLASDSATGYFGTLTKGAVIRFQERYAQEILAPVGLTQGSGFVGSGTLKKINALLAQ